MSVSIQRDLRDAFEVGLRKVAPQCGLERDNGVYVDWLTEHRWQEFLYLGVEVLPSQGQA